MARQDYEDLIFADVTAADGDIEALREIAADVFRLAYFEDASGEGNVEPLLASFLASMQSVWDHTTEDSDPERIARVIATSAYNAALHAAAPPDAPLTWRTMRDDRVREIHQPLEGVTQPRGVPFVVAGTPLSYPGQPVGPPEVWMNCRCHLDTAMAAAAPKITLNIPTTTSSTSGTMTMVARAYDTDQRKSMASRGTAMPDGSYPIADLEDLRNAIQAIGRAKNPEAVKRHIRKRARALGHADLIPDSWTAAATPEPLAASDSSSPAAPVDALIAVNTHDAPGWITNPRETQRLRTYWTRGEGAAKIRWGQPGDFNRCRRQLAKYIHNPEWLAGTCANMHHVALGFWPGQPPHGRKKKVTSALESQEHQAVTAAFTAAAEIDEIDVVPPRAWFNDPSFSRVTPLTVTSDGQVFGHLAEWETCHVGITDRCQPPPRSPDQYVHFHLGEIDTTEGPVSVGQITMETGHASEELGAAGAVSHYDDTGTAMADVRCGEDDHGIWVAGALRPGVTAAQVRALKGGKLSGDWRTIGGHYELVGALVVNVPGFPIPRVTELAASGKPLSLVAAGIVSIDPNVPNAAEIAAYMISALDEREAAKARAARAAAVMASMNEVRVSRLVASVGS